MNEIRTSDWNLNLFQRVVQSDSFPRKESRPILNLSLEESNEVEGCSYRPWCVARRHCSLLHTLCTEGDSKWVNQKDQPNQENEHRKRRITTNLKKNGQPSKTKKVNLSVGLGFTFRYLVVHSSKLVVICFFWCLLKIDLVSHSTELFIVSSYSIFGHDFVFLVPILLFWCFFMIVLVSIQNGRNDGIPGTVRITE